MPQARSGGSRSTSRSKSSSGAKRTSRASQAKRSTSSASASRARSSTRSTGSRSRSSGTTSRSSRTRSSSTRANDATFDAAAQRLRRLNERIIEASKEAGETTLNSYEKALKAIASTIERGPGSSDIEWISNLATAQAKFIREVTTAWTSAARRGLK